MNAMDAIAAMRLVDELKTCSPAELVTKLAALRERDFVYLVEMHHGQVDCARTIDGGKSVFRETMPPSEVSRTSIVFALTESIRIFDQMRRERVASSHAGNRPSHFWDPKDPSSTHADVQLCGYTGIGWYFWDETECHVVGPHVSFEAAEEARRTYVP